MNNVHCLHGRVVSHPHHKVFHTPHRFQVEELRNLCFVVFVRRVIGNQQVLEETEKQRQEGED